MSRRPRDAPALTRAGRRALAADEGELSRRRGVVLATLARALPGALALGVCVSLGAPLPWVVATLLVALALE